MTHGGSVKFGRRDELDMGDLSEGAVNTGGNPPGVASSSNDEPTCAFPGCSSHCVPDSPFCGREDHNSYVASAIASDGTVTGAVDVSGGLLDGTGRSKQRTQRWRKPHHLSQAGRMHRALKGGHELRVDSSAIAGHAIVSGTAIVYDVRTVITDMFGKFGETIRPRAARHLLGGDVRLLANHGGLPLARTTSGTLRLEDTETGVNFAAELDVENDSDAASMVNKIKRGDLSGCSFAFTVADGDDVWNKAMTERTIKRFMSLPEISIVTFPAYPTTSVAARSRALDLQRAHVLARRELLIRRRPPIYTPEGSR
jgi:HK97 family phage prohead protease